MTTGSCVSMPADSADSGRPGNYPTAGFRLKAEVADLLAKAEAADRSDVPDGMSVPDELARREARLAKLAEARAKIAARAKERFEREQAEHQAKLAERAAVAADRAASVKQAKAWMPGLRPA
jgi:hypothetical protein